MRGQRSNTTDPFRFLSLNKARVSVSLEAELLSRLEPGIVFGFANQSLGKCIMSLSSKEMHVNVKAPSTSTKGPYSRRDSPA